MITPDQRIAQLQSTIAARQGRPGYARNVAAMRAELAKLQAAKAAVPKPKPDTPESGGGLTPQPDAA